MSDNSFFGDSFARIDILNLKNSGDYDIVVECGCGEGNTTEWFEKVFVSVIGIEIRSEIYYRTAIRFLNTDARILYGNSSLTLNALMPLLTGNTIFYLDTRGHAADNLVRNLESIIRGVMNEHIKSKSIAIVIPAIFNPERPEFKFHTDAVQQYTFPAIKRFIDSIYGKERYDYWFNKEAQGDKVSMLYICSK